MIYADAGFVAEEEDGEDGLADREWGVDKDC